MDKETYDIEFLEGCLVTITDELADLATWSVYNNDTAIDEIVEAKKYLELVAKVVKIKAHRHYETQEDLND